MGKDVYKRQRLRRQLKEHFRDTTTIMIAQRISSVMHADHILVLEDGDMIGYGTHEELMESCEIYQEISRSQTGAEYKLSLIHIYNAMYAGNETKKGRVTTG